MKKLLPVLFFVFSGACPAAMLQVGPDRALKTPGAAARVAEDGDTIEIAAGRYDGDTAVWRQNNLTIRAVDGRARIQAGPELAQDKAIWVIKGDNTTVEDIEFSGAGVDDRNGAGIRQEGTNLTVRRCYFHHNENGILTNHDPASEITIEHSEFYANGYGDGYSHNIYIGKIKRFTLRFSYSHGADTGHQVKSRAAENHILYNRLMDEAGGTSSYLIDLPNGGTARVLGNLIQQGPDTENSTLVSFGSEQPLHEPSKLYLASNTLVNDRHAGIFLKINEAIDGGIVVNNLFVGHGKMTGNANFINNLETQKPGFVSADDYDYRLTGRSPAVDAGKDIGRIGSYDLTPAYHYVHPAQSEPRPREGRLDIGAYEFSRSD